MQGHHPGIATGAESGKSGAQDAGVGQYLASSRRSGKGGSDNREIGVCSIGKCCRGAIFHAYVVSGQRRTRTQIACGNRHLSLNISRVGTQGRYPRQHHQKPRREASCPCCAGEVRAQRARNSLQQSGIQRFAHAATVGRRSAAGPREVNGLWITYIDAGAAAELLGAAEPELGLSELFFSEPDLSEPDLSDPDLSDPDLSDPDLSDPDLSDPDLSDPDEPESLATALFDASRLSVR